MDAEREDTVNKEGAAVGTARMHEGYRALLQVVDVHAEDTGRDVVVWVFGRGVDGESVSVAVRGFRPHVYVSVEPDRLRQGQEMPVIVNDPQDLQCREAALAALWHERLRQLALDANVDVCIREESKSRYFSWHGEVVYDDNGECGIRTRTWPFLRLSFRSQSELHKFRRRNASALHEMGVGELLEQSISVETKFGLQCGVYTGGWVGVREQHTGGSSTLSASQAAALHAAGRSESASALKRERARIADYASKGETSCSRHLETSFDALENMTEVVRPAQTSFVMCVFDIECYSADNRFPSEWNPECFVFAVALCFVRMAPVSGPGVTPRSPALRTDPLFPEHAARNATPQEYAARIAEEPLGEKEAARLKDEPPHVVHLLCLGEHCAPSAEHVCRVFGSHVVLAEVACFDRELDLLDAFAQLVADRDPDVLAAYNASFDWKYMYSRRLLLRHAFEESLLLHTSPAVRAADTKSRSKARSGAQGRASNSVGGKPLGGVLGKRKLHESSQTKLADVFGERFDEPCSSQLGAENRTGHGARHGTVNRGGPRSKQPQQNNPSVPDEQQRACADERVLAAYQGDSFFRFGRLLRRPSHLKWVVCATKNGWMLNLPEAPGRFVLCLQTWAMDGALTSLAKKTPSFHLRAVLSTAGSPLLKVDLSAEQMFANYRAGPLARLDNLIYSIGDVVSPCWLLTHQRAWAAYLTRSAVTRTRLQESHEASSSCCRTLIYTEAAMCNRVVDVETPREEYAFVQKVGGLVCTPEPAYCPYPVATFDFKSLYPSLMQAFNICPSTLIDAFLLGNRADAFSARLEESGEARLASLAAGASARLSSDQFLCGLFSTLERPLHCLFENDEQAGTHFLLPLRSDDLAEFRAEHLGGRSAARQRHGQCLMSAVFSVLGTPPDSAKSSAAKSPLCCPPGGPGSGAKPSRFRGPSSPAEAMAGDEHTVVVRFASDQESVLKRIEQQMVSKRREVEAEAAREPDELKRQTLLQLGQTLKTVANSVYGYIMMPGRYYSAPVANAITGSGRNMLRSRIAKITSGAFGGLVSVRYGDTDSMMVDFHALLLRSGAVWVRRGFADADAVLAWLCAVRTLLAKPSTEGAPKTESSGMLLDAFSALSLRALVGINCDLRKPLCMELEKLIYPYLQGNCKKCYTGRFYKVGENAAPADVHGQDGRPAWNAWALEEELLWYDGTVPPRPAAFPASFACLNPNCAHPSCTSVGNSVPYLAGPARPYAWHIGHDPSGRVFEPPQSITDEEGAEWVRFVLPAHGASVPWAAQPELAKAYARWALDGELNIKGTLFKKSDFPAALRVLMERLVKRFTEDGKLLHNLQLACEELHAICSDPDSCYNQFKERKRLRKGALNKLPQDIVARKMQQRGAAAPQPGAYITYVYIAGRGEVTSRAEDPEYARQHSLPLDICHYVLKLERAIAQLFEALRFNASAFTRRLATACAQTVTSAIEARAAAAVPEGQTRPKAPGLLAFLNTTGSPAAPLPDAASSKTCSANARSLQPFLRMIGPLEQYMPRPSKRCSASGVAKSQLAGVPCH